MAKRGPEKAFEDALRAELEAFGAIVVKLHGNMFQRDLPDCMVLFAGKVIFFETKADAGTTTEMLTKFLWAKLRPAQLYTAKKWKAKRVLVWVVAGSAKEKCGYAARAGKPGTADRLSLSDLAHKLLGLGDEQPQRTKEKAQGQRKEAQESPGNKRSGSAGAEDKARRISTKGKRRSK